MAARRPHGTTKASASYWSAMGAQSASCSRMSKRSISRNCLRVSLGHGLIMPEPEADGGELEHGEEVRGMLLVARGDAATMLDPVEEALDAVALSVKGLAEAGAPATICLGGNVRRGTGRLDASAEPIGVVGLVGEQD